MAEENIRSLDTSQRPLYLLLCLRRWLSLVLDLRVAGLAVGLIVLAVLLKGTTAGQVGVALTVVLATNSTLLSLINCWTNLETSLGAISRLKTVEDTTPQEDAPDTAAMPPPNWPMEGALEIRSLSASYSWVKVYT